MERWNESRRALEGVLNAERLDLLSIDALDRPGADQPNLVDRRVDSGEIVLSSRQVDRRDAGSDRGRDERLHRRYVRRSEIRRQNAVKS